jgi:hypothetical protein
MTDAIQPKKVPSAYWLWLSDNREAIVKKIGSSKGSEVAKHAGEQWKAIDAKTKETYEKKAAAEKASYEKAMSDFKEQGGVPAARRSKKDKEGKKVKDENAPKRPAGGAYGVFLADQRETIKKSLPADHKITDVTKKASELWKNISEKDKKKYEDLYAKKMETYKAEMEEYKKNGGNAEEDGEEEVEEVAAKPSPKKASPKKRAAAAKDEAAAKPPAAKRGRTAAKAIQEATVTIDASVLAEAEKLGWAGELKNLASRQDVVAAGKSSRILLEALKDSKGLVNPARRALLGA